MPTVPTYPVGGSVQQQSLPAVRSGLNTPFEAFGGGGEGLVSAGQGLMKFSDRVDEIVERDNKVAAKNAFLKLADDANLLDRDLTSRRLSAAGTVYDDGKMQMKALMDKRGSELKNPRQRELFDALAQSRYDSYLQRWNNHQQEQMDKADVLSSKAVVADAVSTAIKDYDFPPMTVIGELDKASGDLLETLYRELDAPIIRKPVEVAEMIKYTCNVWHAAKVTFANEIGNIAKAVFVPMQWFTSVAGSSVTWNSRAINRATASLYSAMPLSA